MPRIHIKYPQNYRLLKGKENSIFFQWTWQTNWGTPTAMFDLTETSTVALGATPGCKNPSLQMEHSRPIAEAQKGVHSKKQKHTEIKIKIKIKGIYVQPKLYIRNDFCAAQTQATCCRNINISNLQHLDQGEKKRRKKNQQCEIFTFPEDLCHVLIGLYASCCCPLLLPLVVAADSYSCWCCKSIIQGVSTLHVPRSNENEKCCVSSVENDFIFLPEAKTSS